MSRPDSTSTTARTRLRRVPRIHRDNGHSDARGTRLDSCTVHPIRELRESPPYGLRALAPSGPSHPRWRRERQVFDHEHAVLWSPVAQPPRADAREVEGASGLPATEPFQHAHHAAGTALLCLEGRELLLKASSGLAGPGVADLGLLPADEQITIVGVDRDQGIGFVQVDPDGNGTSNGYVRQRDDERCVQPTMALGDLERIELAVGAGSVEVCAQRVGYSCGEFESSSNGPDRQDAAAKTGVATSFADEPQGAGMAEGEGFGGWVLVALGRAVRAGHMADDRAGHLRREAHGFQRDVDCAVEFQGRQRRPRVERGGTDTGAGIPEQPHGRLNAFVVLQSDSDRSLHDGIVPYKTCDVNRQWRHTRAYVASRMTRFVVSGYRRMIVYGASERRPHNPRPPRRATIER